MARHPELRGSDGNLVPMLSPNFTEADRARLPVDEEPKMDFASSANVPQADGLVETFDISGDKEQLRAVVRVAYGQQSGLSAAALKATCASRQPRPKRAPTFLPFVRPAGSTQFQFGWSVLAHPFNAIKDAEQKAAAGASPEQLVAGMTEGALAAMSAGSPFA